jgi:hypothetical protein
MANARISLTPDGEVVLQSPAEAHLVDKITDCFAHWRESAAASANAYRRWSDAPRDEKHGRYSAYTAWLDQEQSAARSYELAVAEVQHWLECARR